MHASKEIGLKIGLIAGQGSLPALLVRKWRSLGFTPVIVGLDGITSPELLTGEISHVFSIGQAGHILDFLNQQAVTQVVMVGALKRPNFWTLRTDRVGFQIVLKLLFRRMGDDSLLKTIRREIECRGLNVVGAHEFLPEILCPAGVLGAIEPTPDEGKLIADGFSKAKAYGATDKGQSIVMAADGRIAYETETGTNALIRSCSGWKDAVLVKVSKPQQDLALDMPTIGIKTVEMVHQSGFRGIVVEVGKTIIVDKQQVIEACNKVGIFLMGVEL